MQRLKENNDNHNGVLKLSQERPLNTWQQRIQEPRDSTTADLLSHDQPTETSLQQPSHLLQLSRKIDRPSPHSKGKTWVPEDDHNRLSALPSVKCIELSKSYLPSNSTTVPMEFQRTSKHKAESDQPGSVAADRFSKESMSMSCADRRPRIDSDATKKTDLAMTARPVTSNHESAENGQIPVPHILTLQAAYGNKVNLYRDVLKIKSGATERQIRIAYFREGRVILTDDELSPESKRQFEAISIAYEILSRWRYLYDSCGGDLNKLLSDSRVESGEKQPVLHNQTPSQTDSKMPSLTNRNRGIHWNEKVEEWLYEQSPEKADNLYLDKQATIMGTNEQLQHHHQELGNAEFKREMSNDSDEMCQPETKHLERGTKTVVNARFLAKHLTNFDSQMVITFLDNKAFEESFGTFVEYSSQNDNFHFNDSRTPKKSNRTSKCYEDSIVDLYQSLETSVSPNDVLPRSLPKYHGSDTLARNLFQEKIAYSIPETQQSTNRVEQNECSVDEWSEFQLSLDEKSSRSAFSRDPFAGLNIPSLGSSELPPEFRPSKTSFVAPQQNVDAVEHGTTKPIIEKKPLDGRYAADNKPPSQVLDRTYPKIIVSSPLQSVYDHPKRSTSSGKVIDFPKDTGIPVGTVDLRRFRSNLSTNSGITFEDITTATGGASITPFCDDAFLDHVSSYFSQLGHDMAEVSNRINAEMNKIGTTVGTTITQYSQHASVGLGDIGKSMSKSWEHANQEITSSIP
jgi:hypothetical protein